MTSNSCSISEDLSSFGPFAIQFTCLFQILCLFVVHTSYLLLSFSILPLHSSSSFLASISPRMIYVGSIQKKISTPLAKLDSYIKILKIHCDWSCNYTRISSYVIWLYPIAQTYVRTYIRRCKESLCSSGREVTQKQTALAPGDVFTSSRPVRRPSSVTFWR